MLFNSLTFAIFFLAVCTLYWSLRRSYRSQNLILLGASYFFYGWWDVRFLVLIVLSTVVDYYCALSIDKGRMLGRQRIRGSAFLIFAAIFFLGLKWSAVRITFPEWRPSIVVDWGHFISASSQYRWMLLGILLMTVLFNAIYPLVNLLTVEHRRKFFLIFSVFANLSILGIFKYYDFFADTFGSLAQTLFSITPSTRTLNVILPVGISFYTFQTMSYTIDVYRRKAKATDSLLDVAVYVSFFPQLVAGPIERGRNLLPQFQRPRTMNSFALREGLWLITWGLYKKMVVADNMAKIVNGTFAPFDGLRSAAAVPEDGMRLLVAIYAFAFQIYCDFSGYSDIARGTARLLGFDIMVNFNLPYFAQSPSDFWHRWHISLSTWLRDYLYIPLGGNRHGVSKTYRNLMITMLLGGLWHGAAWTFVLWGAFHGLVLVVYRTVSAVIETWRRSASSCKTKNPFFRMEHKTDPRSGKPVESMLRTTKHRLRDNVLGSGTGIAKCVITFHVVCFGWLIFRAQNITTICVFLRSIFLHPHLSPEAIDCLKNLLFYSWFLVLFQIVQSLSGTLNPMQQWPWFIRLNVWLIIFMSLLSLAARSGQEFIYFAF